MRQVIESGSGTERASQVPAAWCVAAMPEVGAGGTAI